MALAPTPTAASGSNDVPQGAASLSYFVFALFFIFGGITSLNDVILPKLKELFVLNYAQAMLINTAFFFAYFVFSLPGSIVVRKLGYMRAAVVGLVTMMLGCVLFIPASLSGQFAIFLGALFVLAAGITIVQVVANPLISMLGTPQSAHSRLTFAQAFNSLGTTIFPIIGSMVILGAIRTVDQSSLSAEALAQYRAEETQVIVRSYLFLAAAIGVVALAVWAFRNRLTETPDEPGGLLRPFTLLKQPRFALGALCIFLYVGAEVAIGSIIVNFLQLSDVMGLSQKDAGGHVFLYWGGAMVGRFIGSFLLRVVSPGKVLAGVAVGNLVLLTAAALIAGPLSGWALLAIGLCNSIMFPTIFALASEGLGKRAADGSGIIATAIVGGAIVPVIMGFAADATGLKASMIVPAVCYAVIAGYGIYARRSHVAAM
jgi:FHS family L-fucose permease-like MFS transporter